MSRRSPSRRPSRREALVAWVSTPSGWAFSTVAVVVTWTVTEYLASMHLLP